MYQLGGNAPGSWIFSYSTAAKQRLLCLRQWKPAKPGRNHHVQYPGTLSHTAWHLETEQTLVIGLFPRDSATFPEKMVRHRRIECCVQDSCQNFWDAEVCVSWNEKLVCFAKFLLAKGARGSCCSFPNFLTVLEVCWLGPLQCTTPGDNRHSFWKVRPLELWGTQPHSCTGRSRGWIGS